MITRFLLKFSIFFFACLSFSSHCQTIDFIITSYCNPESIIFSTNSNGQNSEILYQFSSPSFGRVIQMPNGLFYGTTRQGGPGGFGTLFQFSKETGNLETLVDFNGENGAYPVSSLIPSGNSNFLYGHTINGGAGDKGVLFRYNISSDNYELLFEFDLYSGKWPSDNIVLHNDNIIFGTTKSEGEFTQGTLFKYNVSNDEFEVLHSFNAPEGSFPKHGIIKVGSNKLYGTTSYGGEFGFGTLFTYDILENEYVDIFHFTQELSGETKSRLVPNSTGEIIYGTIEGENSINPSILYSYNVISSEFIVIHEFEYANHERELYLASDGIVYGISYSFGPTNEKKTELFSYNPVLDNFEFLSEIEFLGNCFSSEISEFDMSLSNNRKSINTTSLKVFPNPAMQDLNIEFSKHSNMLENDVEFVIQNGIGKELKRGHLFDLSNRSKISINELPNGFYILQLIKNEHILYSSKFQKIKN